MKNRLLAHLSIHKYLLLALCIVSSVRALEGATTSKNTSLLNRGSLKMVFFTCLLCSAKAIEKQSCTNEMIVNDIDGFSHEEPNAFAIENLLNKQYIYEDEIEPSSSVPEGMQEVCGFLADQQKPTCIYIHLKEESTLWYNATLVLTGLLMTGYIYYKCQMCSKDKKILAFEKKSKKYQTKALDIKDKWNKTIKKIENKDRECKYLREVLERYCKQPSSESLFKAVSQGKNSFTKLLEQCYIDPNCINSLEEPLVVYAAKNGKKEIIVILHRYGADIDLPDSSGNTALIASAKNDKEESVSTLCTLGADLHLQDSFGYTALMYAEKNKYSNIAQCLKKQEEKSKVN